MVNHVVAVKDTKMIQIEARTPDFPNLRLKQHLCPFLIGTTLLEGFRLIHNPEVLWPENRPINDNRSKDARAGKKLINPSLTQLQISA